MHTKSLSVLALAMALSIGCTPVNLPKTSGATTSGKAAVSLSKASIIRGSVSTLKNALATLFFLGRSGNKKPLGTRSATLKTSPFRIQDVGSATSDVIADTPQSQVAWYWQETASSSATTATESVYTSTVVEEGRVASGSAQVAVERSTYTETFRSNLASSSSTVDVGTYSRTEDVTVSQYRQLGHFVTNGSYQDYADGRSFVNATQVFTPQGSSTSYTTTTSVSNNGNVTITTLSGDNPMGGSLNLTNTVTDNTTSTAAGSGSMQVMNGTYAIAQKGTVTNATGGTFLLDNSETTTFNNGSQTYTEAINVTIQGQVLIHLDGAFDGTNYKLGGTLFTADGTKTALGSISVDPNTYDASVTYTDGTTDALQLEPVFDILSAAYNTNH